MGESRGSAERKEADVPIYGNYWKSAERKLENRKKIQKTEETERKRENLMKCSGFRRKREGKSAFPNGKRRDGNVAKLSDFVIIERKRL